MSTPLTTIPNPEITAPARRHDVDWLRVMAMGTIFLFHCGRFFDHDDWHIKNLVLSHGMDIFILFTAQWIMPLFFILSGIGTFYALGRRTKGNYVRERFLRLVVPLVFGIFFLVPPQVYIERVSHHQFDGSFLSFLPHYFDGWYAFGGNFAWMGLHLWYLEMLFVFSLLTLPLFYALRSDGSRFTRVATAPGTFLFAAALIPVELLADAFPETIGIRSFGGWSPLVYLVFFIIGFVIASDDAFARTFRRFRAAWLALGIVTTGVGLYLVETGVLNSLPRPASLPIEALIRVFNSWFWLMAIMGFAYKRLGFSNRALVYLNRAVLPFYILHQSVIVIVALFLVGWAVSVPVKYLVLAALSFVTIMVLYEGIVRRIGVLRFLFGMKKA